jgi:integral membrane protein
MNFHTYLGRLRLIGFIEGCSFLLLLGIAMPLKYGLGYDVAVKLVGSAHGGLFVLYCLSVLEVMFRYPFGGVLKVFVFWLAAVTASLVPFGTFALDVWLKKMQARLPRESSLA